MSQQDVWNEDEERDNIPYYFLWNLMNIWLTQWECNLLHEPNGNIYYLYQVQSFPNSLNYCMHFKKLFCLFLLVVRLKRADVLDLFENNVIFSCLLRVFISCL